MIPGVIIISDHKYYWILSAKYCDQGKGAHRYLSTQSCIYPVMYLSNMSALHPSRVKTYTGLTLWLPPALVLCWCLRGRVMQEEAVHSFVRSFVHSFVHSLPPCILAWHVQVMSPCSPGSQACQWEPCLAVWLLSAPSEPQGHCARWILSPELTVRGCCLLPGGPCFLPPGQKEPLWDCGGLEGCWAEAPVSALLSLPCLQSLPGRASTCTSTCAPEHVCIRVTRDVFRGSTHVPCIPVPRTTPRT